MTEPTREITVADPGWTSGLWWGVFGLLGAGLGGLLRAIAGWVASLSWAPFQGLFKLIDSLPAGVATIGAVLLGLLAGLAVAYQGQRESLTVTVSARQVRLSRLGETTELARDEVRAVFLDRKQLVVLGPATEELARLPSDLDADRLRAAFTRYGYRWRAGDPYADQFRRWVPDTPELPAAANALLAARQRALARKDHTDAAELRAELARLGIVVREEQQRQYWRRLPAPGSP